MNASNQAMQLTTDCRVTTIYFMREFFMITKLVLASGG
jgi:hypothetical protein